MRRNRGAAARPSKYARWRKAGSTKRRRRHKRDYLVGLQRYASRIVRVIVAAMVPHVRIVPMPAPGFTVHEFDGRGRWVAASFARTRPIAERIAARIRRALRREP
jgi:hypothetical protein